MKKSSWIFILISYYGLLQIAHLLMNFVVLFVSPELVMQASPLLTASQAHYFMITSLVDFVFASPLAIVGAGFLFTQYKKVSVWLTSLSLIFAWLTAIAYVLLLFVFHAFVVNTTNLVFGLLFIPVIILTVLIISNKKLLTS